jgi:HEPN domain-containing protein
MNELNAQEAIRWLEYAYQDLVSAKKMLQEQGFVFRQSCFLSHQAAEKALMSIFVYLQI